MGGHSSTLVICPRCGHGVYRAAQRCPHCRRRLRWNLKLLVVWAIAAAIAVLLGFALAELATPALWLP